MRFTVLIPTFDNGALIRTAIESVLGQTHRDFELLVVTDGAPAETHSIVREYAAADGRVFLRANEKGERHGESHRHQALRGALTDAVCYLSDDDFWFEDHLEVMASLLTGADFAHTRHVRVLPDLTVHALNGDLGNPETRRAMQVEPFNFFGLSVAGHRLDAYRRLEKGWDPAPPGVWTDLHMWRKWLALEGATLRSDRRITSLHFDRSIRRTPNPLFEREPRTWYEAFQDPCLLQALRRLCPEDNEPLALSRVFSEAGRLRHENARAHADRLAAMGVTVGQSQAATFGLLRDIAARDRDLEGRDRDISALREIQELSQRAARESASALAAAQAESLALRSATCWRLSEPLRWLVTKTRG